jgi:predicted HTH transcriptional regulator
MDTAFDLDRLLQREDAGVEWKRNVADVDDVVAKLVAFANDVTGTVSEGWVLCGVEEVKDGHGFPQAKRVGLVASRFRKIREEVLAACRQRVRPPLEAQVFDQALGDDPSRRILVFRVRRSDHAHCFKHRKKGEHHWITADSSVVPVRDRLLTELLRRKSDLPPFLERGCRAASLDDIDRVAAEQFMKDARLPRPAAEYLQPEVAIDVFAKPLVLDEGERAVPTYLALLLFGQEPTRFLPGAW